jgi:DNA sulfur modification protein DndE
VSVNDIQTNVKVKTSMSRISAVFVFAFLFITIGNAENRKQLKDYLADLPFSMPEMAEPRFPGNTVNIVDYGAVPDGHTLNTKAFSDAINACVEAGGGTVVVPPGTWLTGPIRIESNINLHIEKGALVQFSKNVDDFPLIAGFDGKSKRYSITPPISAYRARNIAITGDGIFDGSGEAWRYQKKEKLTARQWKELVASGGVVSEDGKEWWPSKEAMEGEEYLKKMAKSGRQATEADYAKTREFLRPDLVSIVQCADILIDGPTFENSPRYHIHPVQCENLIIRNARVYAPWYGQNTDGIDLSSSRNVVLYNCTVDVGDDGICLKPGTIAKSQAPGPACQNIIVADCVVYHAHGGFVIGSESYGGVDDVSVRNCVFIGTDVGLRFKSLRGRGGLVENVYIDGVQMREIQTDAILFDMYYSGGAPDVEATKDLSVRKVEPVTEKTPRFRDFSIKRVVCNGAERAIVINGLPEMPVKNIVFDSLVIGSKRGVFFADADGIQLNNCRIQPRSGAIITALQCRNVTVRGGTYPVEADVFLKVAGENSENIRLIGIKHMRAKRALELGEGVKATAVIQE